MNEELLKEFNANPPKFLKENAFELLCDPNSSNTIKIDALIILTLLEVVKALKKK